MKLVLALILTAAFVMVLVARTPAQNSTDATQTVQILTAQLHDLQDKEAELKTRLEQLDFDLKPENLERFFNGYGSTHPEELRKSRRDQLQLERNRVATQLEQLTASRAGLEAAISSEKAKAYQQSALGASILSRENRSSPWVTLARVLTGVVIILLVVGSLLLRALIRDRQHTSNRRAT
ncbi:MAG TPA: hypothetical protein VIF64_15955 [Pyrinomonadaceae bacterium]